MDATSRRPNRAAANTELPNGARTRAVARSAASQLPRSVSRTAQTVMKHLRMGDTSTLASRTSDPQSGRSGNTRNKASPLVFLRVRGLKQSKAASNPDGGLSDLINFLERKSSSLSTGRHSRQHIIKKVSLGDEIL